MKKKVPFIVTLLLLLSMSALSTSCKELNPGSHKSDGGTSDNFTLKGGSGN